MSNPTAKFEHAFYIGNYISGILYGVELVMYFLTVSTLYEKKSRLDRRARFLFWFSTVMLCLLTIDVSTNAVWGERMWIDFRDRPGGIPGYIVDHARDWYETLSTTSVAAMILLGDAFIVYRCYVIWNRNWGVVVFPVLMWMATFVLAIFQIVASARATFFGGRAINFGIPYYALSIALNVLMSSLIVFRILQISKDVSRALGQQRARIYTSVSATIVESAAPYAIIGVMFIVPYGIQSDIAIGFGQVYAKMTCLAPQFIVLRVVCGIAWESQMTEAHTTERGTVVGSSRSHTMVSTESRLEFRNDNQASITSQFGSPNTKP